MDKIFVSIISYGDSDLVPTVKDLLKNAAKPQNLDIVIFRQSVPEQDISEIKYLNNVLLIDVDYSKSKGVGWAIGNILPNLNPGFKYFLQVDSHMRFDKDWDITCIEELKKRTTKSLLSLYPSQYLLSVNKKTKGYQVNYADHVRENGSIQFGAKYVDKEKGLEGFNNSTVACGFLFGPVEFLFEVPQDPYVDFAYQETDITIRAYTHGWDIYSLSVEGVVYHVYERINRICPPQYKDTRDINQKNRFYYKIGALSKNEINENDLFRIDEYSIGNKRSVYEFEKTYKTILPLLHKNKKVISIPVAVHNDHFKFQLDLFWYFHKKWYGDNAKDMAHAIILTRNHPHEEKVEKLQWDMDIPHTMCNPYFDHNPEWLGKDLMQTNIQIGIEQIINKFEDDDIVEILDCDLFHLKPRPILNVKDDEIYVDTIYEDWHLKSKTDYKFVIDRYLHNDGGDYNGGFVPIICNVRTLKKIMHEWVAVNLDIVNQDIPDGLKWWSAMYALSAACEKNKVSMIEYNKCYIHNINALTDDKYICHYSVDGEFIHKNNKEHLFSKENYIKCKESKNPYANLFAEWFEQSEYYK
tara:strand:+ start:2165 stop:3907 length:1743 start_codon:yes stop_codon:yes gene_type:complete